MLFAEESFSWWTLRASTAECFNTEKGLHASLSGIARHLQLSIKREGIYTRWILVKFGINTNLSRGWSLSSDNYNLWFYTHPLALSEDFQRHVLPTITALPSSLPLAKLNSNSNLKIQVLILKQVFEAMGEVRTSPNVLTSQIHVFTFLIACLFWYLVCSKCKNMHARAHPHTARLPTVFHFSIITSYITAHCGDVAKH